MSEEGGECLLEGLAEASPHESIHNRVDRGVGVRHTVGPSLDLVCGIIDFKVGVEGLEEGKDLNGTPANGEQHHDDDHHFGNLTPDGNGSLREQVHLKQNSMGIGQALRDKHRLIKAIRFSSFAA